MQGVHNNYEIDLFQSLLKGAAALTECSDLSNQSLRVIADHIRSCSFLIIDGVVPSNEGRGYVLRRIMRRAIRHGNKLGAVDNFFYQLVPALVGEMGDAYPELVKQQAHIVSTILAEEEQFARTLHNGMNILNAAIANVDNGVLAGDVIFKLYDTYGFPADLTNDVAREHNIGLDHEGFEAAMAEQRKRSQAAGSFGVDYTQTIKLEQATQFTGYEQLQSSSNIQEIFVKGDQAQKIGVGDDAVIVLDSTPFYAESGGQAGDSGVLISDAAQFAVSDTTKSGNAFLHRGKLISGELCNGDTVTAEVDENLRNATRLNHSATHLLHAALRNTLGDHVTQKGSLVDADKLRFDFSHPQAVTPQQLVEIQALVNTLVLANSEVATVEASMDDAKAMGAMALFGEKYGEAVRVLSMGDGFSVELCGGTHARRTGDIGQLLITSESGVAAGVRRIEAVTGKAATAAVSASQQTQAALYAMLNANENTVLSKVSSLQETQRKLEKEVDRLKASLANSSGKDLAETAVDVNGIKVLMATINGADAKALRTALDRFKDKLGKAVVVLAGIEGDKTSLVAGVTKAESQTVRAGDVLREFAGIIGGKGGGKPEMAQGGGGDVTKIDAAFSQVLKSLQEKLTD